ncbi:MULTISPECIES: phosphatase PAP2 family protein [Acinetobacter]|uniref:undecaprenyl-diphosphate phosphatase n=2 Tax=Acinetobacter baylyi TaxID=202950 RepID=Q6F8F8_ACIAD|nr:MULTISPECIES: phosphatase PAP2 family protein [Acinetobacter]ENV53204.1 hypothetical protein F952_02649 [Acinetobacter baylyi DSM 14961 = CIP 107474]KAF2372157.1 phosphatidylglycerophosphatase [Acinetobacter baylyi]KAF2372481.1 phosphatidylglycerophosphatase [Acinetobacter baylyi]KAF2376927.1 phosphatidylglycerophosphatase [Acinetobacter baylyi]KAF2379770.1 phosphatidylglycerophosphatase [Acinetobacter baylyi]
MPYLLLCIGCIFFTVSVFALFSPLAQEWDLLAVQFLSQHRSPSLDSVSAGFALLGGMPFVLFFSTLWCVQHWWHRRKNNVIFIISGVLGSIGFGWLLKWCFDRPRPPEMYHLVNSYGASFPSAHSVYAATLATLAIFIYRGHARYSYVALLSCLWFIIMGVSRVYAGVHYPSDVLAGWGIGFIWISLLWLGLLKIKLDKNNLFFR